MLVWISVLPTDISSFTASYFSFLAKSQILKSLCSGRIILILCAALNFQKRYRVQSSQAQLPIDDDN